MYFKYLIFFLIILYILADVKPEFLDYKDLNNSLITIEVIQNEESKLYEVEYGTTLFEFLKDNNLKASIELNETYVLANHDVIHLDESEKKSINLISVDELSEIPYISRNNAIDIVNYRNKYGNFKDLDELANIKGIGESKLKIIKEYLCI